MITPPVAEHAISNWLFQHQWLSLSQISQDYIWTHGNTTRALPKHTKPFSKLNGYGDAYLHGVYPGTSAWLWVDAQTQGIYLADTLGDQLIRLPDPHIRSGDAHWIDAHTVLWVEEDTETKTWSIWKYCQHNQSTHQLWQDDRTLSSPRYHNNKLGFISWNHEDMPWDESTWNLLEPNGSLTTLALPQAAWSQPIIHNDKLYLIGSLNDHRAIYQIDHETPIQITDHAHDVGEIEWTRGRSDYTLWNDSVYYAHQRYGLWKWSSVQHNTTYEHPMPWLQHDSWHTAPHGPLVFGSSLSQKGYCDLEGHAHSNNIDNPLSPWSSRTDELPNQRYTQSWIQYTDKTSIGSVIWLHGGPADVARPRDHSATKTYLQHGFDVYHINTIGSSGFGKSYRNELYGKWGRGDGEDIALTLNLWKELKVLRSPFLVIHARSSSGWTALHLSQLIQADAYIFYYPVVDAHKSEQHGDPFEHGYLKRLMGSQTNPPPHPTSPLYVFQGKKDIVVPHQAIHLWWEQHAIHPLSQIEYFEHEGHGFSSTIKHQVILKEIAWLKNIFKNNDRTPHEQ